MYINVLYKLFYLNFWYVKLKLCLKKIILIEMLKGIFLNLDNLILFMIF